MLGPIKVRNVVAFAWGVMISFVIAQNETIIKQNQLRGVMDPSETGQMIPLTIGVCQFALVTYRTWVKGNEVVVSCSCLAGCGVVWWWWWWADSAKDQVGVRNLQRDFRRSTGWVRRVSMRSPAVATPSPVAAAPGTAA